MLDKLERWFGRFALSNVTLYIIIGQIFVALSALLNLRKAGSSLKNAKLTNCR